ncbi:MAG: MBL fold metallo-hydrolase [Oligoflexales bacterium]|nr:MBL fold metallo-hydrolase [Oligoflexales bacterium]
MAIASLKIQHFYDKDTGTLSYVVHDTLSKDAVIIDPVMDFDPKDNSVHDHSATRLLSYCREQECSVHLIFETHAHADHLSGSSLVQKAYPRANTAIGREITIVQKAFVEIFQITNLPCDGSAFDLLFSEEEPLRAGSIEIQPIHIPGHTPACYGLKIGNNFFTGDAIFAADLGTGRCDFPGGNPRGLFRSIKEKIYRLEDETMLYFGHDYPEQNKRELCYCMPLAKEKEENIRVSIKVEEEDFVRERQKKDKTLPLPRLFYPSLLSAIHGGNLPIDYREKLAAVGK